MLDGLHEEIVSAKKALEEGSEEKGGEHIVGEQLVQGVDEGLGNGPFRKLSHAMFVTSFWRTAEWQVSF